MNSYLARRENLRKLRLLETWVRMLVTEAVTKKFIADLIIAAAEENNQLFGSWVQKPGKRGEIRLSPESQVPQDWDAKSLLAHAGFDVAPGQLRKSEKYDTWDIFSPRHGSASVVFAYKSKDKPLETKQKLGYGAENAVYCALKNKDLKAADTLSSLKELIQVDTRLDRDLKAASMDDVNKFINECFTMVNSVHPKLQDLFRQVGVTSDPKSLSPLKYGSAGFDISGEFGEDRTKQFVFHVKYQTTRLVGIPKRKKNVKIETAVIEKSASDIFQEVRDEMLFKVPVKYSTVYEPGTKLLRKDLLTDDFGMRTRDAQERSGVSEITSIMNDDALRFDLQENLSRNKFESTLVSSLKKQLGFQQSLSEKVSVFVNFDRPDSVRLQFFDPAVMPYLEFEVSRGKNAREAYVVSCDVFRDDVLVGSFPKTFSVELGSIERGKYVQIHKGEDYEKFSKAISDFQNNELVSEIE